MRAVSSDKTPIKLPTKRKNSGQKRDDVEELMINELEIQKRRTAKELTEDGGYLGQHVAATLFKFND